MKRIFLILSMVATMTACGQQEPPTSAWPNSASGDFIVINPTANPIPIQIEPYLTAKSGKTAFLATGEQFSESVLNPGATATVAGCIDATHVGGSYVCYENDETAMKTASDLAYSTIQQQVESWAGSTGNPEIIVIKNPGNFYTGVYQSTLNRIIIAAQPSQQENIRILAHELTHSTYYQARKTPQPLWLNETLAVMSETVIAKVPARQGISTPSLTSWNGTVEDYNRCAYLARFLSWSQSTVETALQSEDVLFTLSGMTLEELTIRFWSINWLMFTSSTENTPWGKLRPFIPLATVETTEIPAYGAVLVSGHASWGVGGILK